MLTGVREENVSLALHFIVEKDSIFKQELVGSGLAERVGKILIE